MQVTETEVFVTGQLLDPGARMLHPARAGMASFAGFVNCWCSFSLPLYILLFRDCRDLQPGGIVNGFYNMAPTWGSCGSCGRSGARVPQRPLPAFAACWGAPTAPAEPDGAKKEGRKMRGEVAGKAKGEDKSIKAFEKESRED